MYMIPDGANLQQLHRDISQSKSTNTSLGQNISTIKQIDIATQA